MPGGNPCSHDRMLGPILALAVTLSQAEVIERRNEIARNSQPESRNLAR